MGCSQSSDKISAPRGAGKTLLTSRPIPMSQAGMEGAPAMLKPAMLPIRQDEASAAAGLSPEAAALSTPAPAGVPPPPTGAAPPPLGMAPPLATLAPPPTGVAPPAANSVAQVELKSAAFGRREDPPTLAPSPLRSTVDSEASSASGSFVSSYTAISNFSFGPRVPTSSSRSGLRKSGSRLDCSVLDTLQEDEALQYSDDHQQNPQEQRTAPMEEDQIGKAVETAVHAMVDAGENIWNRAESLWQSTVGADRLEDDDNGSRRTKRHKPQLLPWACGSE